MSTKLQTVFKECLIKHRLRLLTQDFYDKDVRWFHIIENDDFYNLLSGGEIVLNSSMNGATPAIIKRYIRKIAQSNPAAIILATEDDKKPSAEIIRLCDELRIPLFHSRWDVSYGIISLSLAELLLADRKNEVNRKLAVNNLLFRPENELSYKPLLGTDPFFLASNYIVAVISNVQVSDKTLWCQKIETELRFSLARHVIITDEGRIIVVLSDYKDAQLLHEFKLLSDRIPGMRIGIGTHIDHISQLAHSYDNALTAHNMIDVVSKNILFYQELGIFQLLSAVEDHKILDDYVRETLGALIDYDRENKTAYLPLLEAYFANECNTSRTADKLFFHRNTMKYKLAEIEEILGYDYTTNENRLRIMLSFQIMKINR